ncbi:MAG: D-2-hydroxyacid dehydrogenase, partial [Clostridia bacterium]|nr:D-2-hydroxyacid dehydrogenase [Clostridia bacterium]
LNFYGRIGQYNASVAAGDWIKSDNFCYYLGGMRELYGKSFGVYGYGNIGKAVAKVAEAFGAKVFVCTRTVPENCPYEVVSFEKLLGTCDVISLHCPLTEATANMINKKTLALMKKDAVLVNTARGGLVDEAALAEALNAGRLGGACLDVVDSEPMLADNPLLTAKNCLITPHVAWLARETRERLFDIVAGNLRAFIEGKPRNVVS